MTPSSLIPVHVQYRHVHLSEADARILFGDRPLSVRAELAHRGQHAAEQTVDVVGPNGGQLDRVRVYGPFRESTQVELSPTEAFALGIDAPVRLSGDTKRSAGCELIGPEGRVRLRSGVVIPARHLHCNERDAARLGIEHQSVVTVSPAGRPDLRVELVSVRVHPTFALSFHLTYDEASEFWIQTGDHVVIL